MDANSNGLEFRASAPLDTRNYIYRQDGPDELWVPIARYVGGNVFPLNPPEDIFFGFERDEPRAGNGRDTAFDAAFVERDDDARSLEPNPRDITRHLYALFQPDFVKDFPDAWIEVAWATQASDWKPKAAKPFSPFDLKAAAEFAEKKNRDGANVYIGPSLRTGTTGESGRASEQNYLASAHSWADFDGAGDADRISAIMEARGLANSMLVRTGTAPHTRGHPYFRIAGAVTAEQVKAINAGLKNLFETDDVDDPCRLMRLAGTVSYPPPDKVARGYIPEQVTLLLRNDAPAYTAEQMMRILDTVASAAAPAPGRVDDEIVNLLETSRTKGKWHNSVRNAIASMLGRGWSDLAIRLACAPYCKGGAGDPDLAPLIDDGRAKWSIPDAGDGLYQIGKQAAAGILEAKAANGPQALGSSPYELFWHGVDYKRELRPWLVKDLIFERGSGLASGQWGTAKTFIVLDLAASVMTGLPFAGREVIRQGGVLFVAAEGASEISIRLKGLVEHKLRPEIITSGILGQPITANIDELPFAWIEDSPNLQNPVEFSRLMETAKQAEESIRERFGLPLALIITDTLSAIGNFKDANSAAEGQFVMNRLVQLGRHTGGFALAVDHFGKDKETGTRGTSAKEGAADVILAMLADREINGTVSNMRMALRKLRGGKVGIETPLDLRVVEAAEGETTCIVQWRKDKPAGAETTVKERWPKTLKMFKSAMETALIEYGKPMRPYGSEGPEVRAARYEDVREEFVKAYPADGDAKDKGAAKRQAFGRAMKSARDKELVCSRELGGIDYLWLVEPEPVQPRI